MERESAHGKRYTLDNLMNFNGLPVVEIRDVHRIRKVLVGATAYVFRINDREHHELFHTPVFTTNVFVGDILPAIVDFRAVATWSFPSEADVPFYKWRLFDMLLRHDVLEEVDRGGRGGASGRYELALNRGPRFASLDLVGYSTLVRLPTREGEGGFEGLCRTLAGPLWFKLDRTVEHDRLAP